MDQFQLWLSNVVSPVRYTQLIEALLVIDTAHPKAMQDLVETVTSKINSLDTDQLLFNLQQGTVDALAFALQQYEVILKQDLTFEQLTTISQVLDTLNRLEYYEGSEELLGYLDGEESIEDQLVKCLQVFYPIEDSVLELVEYWNPLLLGKIRSIHQQKIKERYSEIEPVVMEIPTALKDDPRFELARSYLRDGGRIGLPFEQYVTVFSESIHSDSPAVEQALVWYQLGLLANLPEHGILAAAKQYFDSVYPNLPYLSSVYRALLGLTPRTA